MGQSINRGAADKDLAEKATELAGRASEQLGRVVENVDATARSVAEQGRQAGEQAQVVAEDFKSALDKSVKEQPLTTLAFAAVLGFVLGALWKS